MSHPPCNAFIAGATGYTGREVVRACQEAGLHSIAHIRSDSPRRSHWEAHFASLGATVACTSWEPHALLAAFEQHQPNIVFGLLGTTKTRTRQAAQQGKIETYETIDYQLTNQLYQAAQATPSVQRFVYLSSSGVRDHTRNAYLEARWKVEQVLQTGELPFTIARPSFITGPDRDEFRAIERFGSVVSDHMLRVIGWLGGKQLQERYRSTTNVLLANALVRHALLPQSANTILESEQLR